MPYNIKEVMLFQNLIPLGQALIDNASPTTLYTVPDGYSAIVNNLHVANLTGSAIGITIWADQDGAETTDSEAIMKNMAIPANAFMSMNTAIAIGSNGTLKALANTPNAVTITVSGSRRDV